MIVYSASKLDFCNDVRLNKIDSILFDRTLHKQGRRTAESEVRSWRNSLQFMNNIMLDKDISDDSNIAIEYKIPGTSFRIDFVISGIDEKENKVVPCTFCFARAKQSSVDRIPDSGEYIF